MAGDFYEDFKKEQENNSIYKENNYFSFSENRTEFPMEGENYSSYKGVSMEPNRRDREKRTGLRRILALIAMALIFSILGGIIGSVGTFFYVEDKFQTINKKIDNYKNFTTAVFEKNQEALSVAEVVKRVAPAVVGVSIKSIVNYGYREGVEEGIGSGFIINKEGYILTNYHVIEGASSVKVVLSDGRETDARVINYDAQQDLAVIRIIDDVELPGVVELGDSSSLLVGEQVVAIGNPLGLEFLGTVTTGVVSALNREVTISGKSITYIQTDAAINPGNSGGPLVNSKGEVIGINTAKIKTEGVEGIGFSIPINGAKDRLEALSKPILRIGIVARDITPLYAKNNDLHEGEYVLVIEVQKKTPAEKAGIIPGDMIISFDGQRIKTVSEINLIKEKHSIGDLVEMIIIRDGIEQKLQIVLEQIP